MKDAPARYSDEVPYEKRKYWYFTTHGVGPGAIPKDLKVLEIRKGQNDKGTWGEYVCLDGILNTDELSTFDMRELKPPMNDGSMRDDAWVEKYLIEHNFDQHGSYDGVFLDEDGLNICGVTGDWKHTHLYLKEIMKSLGYRQVYENCTDGEDEINDWYTADHLYQKIENN